MEPERTTTGEYEHRGQAALGDGMSDDVRQAAEVWASQDYARGRPGSGVACTVREYNAAIDIARAYLASDKAESPRRDRSDQWGGGPRPMGWDPQAHK